MTKSLHTGFKDVMGKDILVGDLLMYPTSCSSVVRIHFSIVTGLTKNGKKLLVETIEPLPWGTSLFQHTPPTFVWDNGERKQSFVEDVYFKSVWIDRVDRAMVLFEHIPFAPCLIDKLADEIVRVQQEWQNG